MNYSFINKKTTTTKKKKKKKNKKKTRNVVLNRIRWTLLHMRAAKITLISRQCGGQCD